MRNFIAVNRSQTILPLGTKKPSLDTNVFVAPNASVIGDVKLGKGSSVWYGAILRGDVNTITVGEQTNIQDNAVVHVARYNVQKKPAPTRIGSNVTIGHAATIHACTLEDSVVVGMGATIMDGAVVKKGSIVAAGSIVTANTVINSNEVWAGAPAKLLRKLEQGEAEFIEMAAMDYAQLAAVHAEENAKSFVEVELDNARREDRAMRDPDYDAQQGVERDPETREIVRVAQST